MKFDPVALRRRFRKAIAGYAVLGALAALTLDGALRWAVLLFLAALVLRSWTVWKREELG